MRIFLERLDGFLLKGVSEEAGWGCQWEEHEVSD